MRSCARQGTGFLITPLAAVGPDIEAGRLTRLDWVETDRETAVTMIWHEDKWCSPLLKQFMAVSENWIKRGKKYPDT